MELRPRQKEVVEKTLKFLSSAEKRPGIIVAPTGFGKSLVVSAIAKEYDGGVLVIQPSKELVMQNYEKLIALGGEATIYSASVGEKNMSKLTFATLGSIKGLAKEFKDMGVSLVLIDECDSSFPPDKTSVFRKFIDKLEPKKVIGLTATPFRMKNGFNHLTGETSSQLVMLNRMRPMYFKHFIDVVQIQELTSVGYWSKLRYIKYSFDTTHLKYNTTGSDFTESSVRKALEVQGVNNNIFSRVVELMDDPNEKILVFCDSVETAQVLSNNIPYSAALSGTTSRGERNRIVKGFTSGKIRVVFNYGVLAVGFDYPGLNRIILGRPTNSLRVYYQIIGRGVRVDPGKELCYIEDFCGNMDRFGRVEDLTVEDFPNYGWGVFNRNVLMTGVDMGTLKVTKEKLLAKKREPTEVLWFGRDKGKSIDSLNVRSLQSLSDWIGSLSSPSPKLKDLNKSVKNLLKENASI
jgi:DNA repair protein RadD